MKKKFLMIITLLLIVICIPVKAETIKIEDIVNVFAKAPTIKLLNSLYDDKSQLSAQYDEENNKINMLSGLKVVSSAEITDDALTFTSPVTELTKEIVEADDEWYNAMLMQGLLESEMTLSDHENYTLGTKAEELKNNIESYNKYGFEIATKYYKIQDTTEENATENLEGNYLMSYKISRDTEKINELVKSYGSDSKLRYADLDLEVEESTSSMIKFKLTTDLTEDDKQICLLERSESEDGKFSSEFNGWTGISCYSHTIKETNVEPGKTYYYRITLYSTNNENSSKVIKVTTPEEEKTKDTKVTNPKTGIKDYAFIGAVIISIIAIAIINIKKKSFFRN